MVRLNKKTDYGRVAYALGVSSALSLMLFWLRFVDTGAFRYEYLFWNLFLAWLPLAFAWWLMRRLRRTTWQNGVNLLLTLLWLGFLPNSFYVVSDLIHLEVTGEVSLLYDVVLFCSFIFNAYTAGFISVYVVHRELLRRMKWPLAHTLMACVILLCSFAIYLGRYLRWNTWDLLINPAGLLFDVSDRLISPSEHPQAVVTTATFFLFIGTIYIVVWQLAQALRSDNR